MYLYITFLMYKEEGSWKENQILTSIKTTQLKNSSKLIEVTITKWIRDRKFEKTLLVRTLINLTNADVIWPKK